MSDATLRSVLAQARRLQDAGAPFVLATLMATEGSSYRKAGAAMIFGADDSRTGMLAGGDVEEALARQARAVLEAGSFQVIECGLPGRPDAGPAWQGEGAARILLQCFGPHDRYYPFPELARALGQSRCVVLGTVIESEDPALCAGTRFLCGTSVPLPLPPALADDAQATATAAATAATPMLVRQHTGAGEVTCFYAPFFPPLNVLLLGAVPDSVPVSRFARLLGWRNTIADPRSALCVPDRFPDADAVLSVDPDNLEAVLNLDRVDAALLLTRSFEQDQRLLPALARSAIPFVGILGSRNRCARLMATLGDDAALLQGRVHGPVGLDLRCDGAEEIALSIVAQIQSTHQPGHRLPHAPPVVAVAAPAQQAPAPAAAPELWAVVLAAGGSRRFGGFKQMIEWEGESLLRRATRIGIALCGERVVVVHGPKPTKCQRELAGFDVRHVINEHWESGMALSLKTGLRALPEDCGGALVLLCDQPLLQAGRVSQLVETWQQRPERIVASAYAGIRGVPAIFPRRLFPELRRLTGDRGARTLLENHLTDVVDVDMPEAAVDIDTQDDYASLITQGGRTP